MIGLAAGGGSGAEEGAVTSRFDLLRTDPLRCVALRVTTKLFLGAFKTWPHRQRNLGGNSSAPPGGINVVLQVGQRTRRHCSSNTCAVNDYQYVIELISLLDFYMDYYGCIF